MSGDRVLFHILGHVDAHHRLFIIEEELRERLRSSVLPTPVGPMKMNDPIGRLGSCRPARARRTAFATATIASRWPITRCPRRSSILSSLSRSPSSSLETGYRSTGRLFRRYLLLSTLLPEFSDLSERRRSFNFVEPFLIPCRRAVPSSPYFISAAFSKVAGPFCIGEWLSCVRVDIVTWTFFSIILGRINLFFPLVTSGSLRAFDFFP